MTRDWQLKHSSFKAIDALFEADAFDASAKDHFFVPAMREAFQYHYDNSREFKGHADLASFKADQIKTLTDVENIPWIFIQNFKDAELLSIPKEKVFLTLTSSGTGGSKTRLFLDELSLNRIEVAAYKVYRDMGAVSLEAPASNALLFTYDIERMPNLGTAWTDELIAQMSPCLEKAFLIRADDDGSFYFDLELALKKYEKFVRSGKPLRILGFPAFISEMLYEIQLRGNLPRLSSEAAKHSWVLTGGGWKNHKGVQIPKAEFAKFIEKMTAIPAVNVRDLFGMSEHGVGYLDCEHGRLHVPTYAHAVTRDPFTLKTLPLGAPGLLHLYSPLLQSYPSISLLTTDEARLDPSPCACGRQGVGLEIVGRVGLKNYEGCALKALEYLR